MKQLKKTLKSALVFAMALALCGTTLGKAYATYARIVVEHVFVDNNNTYGESESEQDSAVENGEGADESGAAPASTPRDALADGIEAVVNGSGYHYSGGRHRGCGEVYTDVTVNVKGPEDGNAAIAALTMDSEDAAQAVTDALADQLSGQLGDDSAQQLSEEQADALVGLIAEELENIKCGQRGQRKYVGR